MSIFLLWGTFNIDLTACSLNQPIQQVPRPKSSACKTKYSQAIPKKGDVGSKATYDFFPEDIWPRILP